LKVNELEITRLALPYSKPLITATNKFVTAHGLLVKVVDAINTSIQKTGSIREVKRIAELCELGGIRCALSNTAGSMVGNAAALHVAASTPAIVPLCELGEFETISQDPFTGLAIDRGNLRVPQGDGLGVTLETLARNPNHFGASSGQGLCHMSLGEYREAAICFRKALEIHPHLTAVRQNLALAEAQSGDSGGFLH
jgi:hypothetical protein